MKHSQSKAILQDVLDYYQQLARKFSYPYPTAGVAAHYRLSVVQLKQIRMLVRDVHAAQSALLKALTLESTNINGAVIGSELQRLQKHVLSAAPKYYGRFPFCYRIDAIWTGTTFKVLEVNPDNAGGLEDSFDLRMIYERHVPHSATNPIAASALATTLTHLLRGAPIRVVYTDGICRVLAFRLAGILARFGVSAMPLHLNELADENPDACTIYRHFLFEDLFVHDPSGDTPIPSKEAVRHFLHQTALGNYLTYNALADRLLFDKRLLAPEVAVRFLAPSVLKRFLSWVAPTKVITRQIAETLLSSRSNTLVVKSARGLGGKSVYPPGKNFSNEPISDGNWVSQQFIPPERITVLRPGGWESKWNLVHGIFVVNGNYAGDHIRVSPSDVVNVSNGGGMIPAF